jgi:hypothetical protein
MQEIIFLTRVAAALTISDRSKIAHHLLFGSVEKAKSRKIAA